MKRIEIKTPKNPNKWGKQLAPWFDDKYKAAKNLYLEAKYIHGRDSQESKEAAGSYRRTCMESRREFSRELPDLLKYKPK